MGIEQVDPANCTLWQFHQRFGDELSERSCQDLLTSMHRHGQRHAVLGRRLEPKTGPAIELIYGGRRLFAATSLGIKLMVDVQDLDERAAIIAMDIETRVRTD
ncbi:MAG TPA: ParB N-terminal domain-containing protein, partial [Steroidobacteraceae bacterium]|nr:ParB N-terminal domain-containing protein [Steroidobacteraceae bacterium]